MDYKSIALELVDLYGYWALFITMFIDTLGIPMPSKTMLTLSGYFSHMGIFGFTQMFVVAMVGTLGGFASGYTIGRKIGKPFLEKFGPYVRITPEKIAGLEKWFAKKGIYAIFIAYFLPVARSVVPYLAGISKMAFVSAMCMAALGAACWIILLMSFGLVIGQHWMKIEALISNYYHMLIWGLILFFGVYVFRKRAKKKKNKENM